MNQFQKGEVVLVVMVAMMVIVWMVSGHMGMMGMGHDAGHGERPVETVPAAESGSTASAVPAASPEHPH